MIQTLYTIDLTSNLHDDLLRCIQQCMQMVCHPNRIFHYSLIHIAILFMAGDGQFGNAMQDGRNRTRSVPVRH